MKTRAKIIYKNGVVRIAPLEVGSDGSVLGYVSDGNRLGWGDGAFQNVGEKEGCFVFEQVDTRSCKVRLKEAAIYHGMECGYTWEREDFEKAEKEFTCFQCQEEQTCKYAWDLYNLSGDCLASK